MIYNNISKNVSLEDAIVGLESWGYVAEHGHPEIMYANIFGATTGTSNYTKFVYNVHESCYTVAMTFEGLPALKEYLISTYGSNGKFDVYCWLTDVVHEVAGIPIQDLINRDKNTPLADLLNAEKKVADKKLNISQSDVTQNSNISAVNISDEDTDDVAIMSIEEAAELINSAVFAKEQENKKIMNSIRSEYNKVLKEKLDKGKFTIVSKDSEYIYVEVDFSISTGVKSKVTVKHIEAFSKELKEHGIENSFTNGTVANIYTVTIKYKVKRKK